MTRDVDGVPLVPRRVLVVEDEAGDMRLVREAIEGHPRPIEAEFVSDGEGALERLTGAPQRVFDLVLLDLRLPGCDGLTVLERARAAAPADELPIVVLTSVVSDAETTRCYENGANAVAIKPQDLDDYVRIVDRVLSFWLSC